MEYLNDSYIISDLTSGKGYYIFPSIPNRDLEEIWKYVRISFSENYSLNYIPKKREIINMLSKTILPNQNLRHFNYHQMELILVIVKKMTTLKIMFLLTGLPWHKCIKNWARLRLLRLVFQNPAKK